MAQRRNLRMNEKKKIGYRNSRKEVAICKNSMNLPASCLNIVGQRHLCMIAFIFTIRKKSTKTSRLRITEI